MNPTEQPPGRGEHRVHGRLGPLHQEHRQPADLVGPRDPWPGRDHLRRLALIRDRPDRTGPRAAGHLDVEAGRPPSSLVDANSQEYPSMSPRIFALAVATVAVLVSIVGCGGGEPQFDPSTKYSTGSLAQEFAFRYKALDRSKPAVVAEKPEGVPTKAKGAAVTKGGGPATKAARSTTLDALLGDVIAKAAMIPDLSHAEACKKVAEEVANDPTFSVADKKIIADRLGQATD